MGFISFRSVLQKNFAAMTKNAVRLYETDVDKDGLWELYLNSFAAGTNSVFRKRSEHDCSCCRHFIRDVGNVVAIIDGKIVSIWDGDMGDPVYQVVADVMSAHVKSRPIKDVFFTTQSKIGVDHNYDEDHNRFDHFVLEIPANIRQRTRQSEGEFKGERRDIRNVFKRSLDELTMDSVETALELIAQNSLYRGEEFRYVLQEFLKCQKEYAKLMDARSKSIYAWSKTANLGAAVCKIRNSSIGTLLVDISVGLDLDEAVRKYEAVVAPANYKRPKAIFTKKMVEDAQKKMQELGYIESLGRRFATLDDISVNNILFSNKDEAKRIGGATDVFTEMSNEVALNPKKFDRAEEISIENFISKVLPTALKLEVLPEWRHRQNLMSLTAPKNPEAKSMFKWSNGFGWAYAGNIADSDIRENVKAAGGKVDGVLRFSIQWNDKEFNPNDFDAHCIEPGKFDICYHQKLGRTCGELDVDIIRPERGKPAVENITWMSKGKMVAGTYKFYVHCYSSRGGRSGFRAEIAFDGQTYSFEYNKELRTGECVEVAEVTMDGNGHFAIHNKLESNVTSEDMWGVQSNQFAPVSVVMYSPNYWDGQTGIGNRHYFFMMNGCVNPETPNGFYNEFLRDDLMQHKRVLEALGGKMKVEDTEDQLSGLGFSSTRRNDIIVRVTGATQRVLRVKF